MVLDYLQPAMQIIGVVLLSIFGYYAVRLLSSFKRGILEGGWRLVTAGAIVLVIAQFPLLLAGQATSKLMFDLVELVYVLRFIGIVFLTLGFRAQYQIWRVDKKSVATSTGREIEA